MLTTDPGKKLTIRLTEAQRRRIKSVAAGMGLSLQEALDQAFEAWIAQHDPQGGQLHRRELHHRATEDAKGGKEQPEAEKVVKSVLGGRGASSVDLLHRSGSSNAPGARHLQASDPPAYRQEKTAGTRPARVRQIDWSQCPEVERAEENMGRVWVFRGTEIPLMTILQNLTDGYSLKQIVEHYKGLTAEQVKSVVRFAAQGGRLEKP